MVPCLALAQSAQSAHGNTNAPSGLPTYVDIVNGITFRYPASWLLNQGGGSYIPTLILQKPTYDPTGPWEYKPDGYVALDGRDVPRYQNTNFGDGWFLYRGVSGVDDQKCQRKADFIGDPTMPKGEWSADWVVIGGVRFRHGWGNGEAMCHESSQSIYSTYRGGKCYLFEIQINTLCPQHVAGLRDITPRELSQINREFDQVMLSVRFRETSDR